MKIRTIAPAAAAGLAVAAAAQAIVIRHDRADSQYTALAAQPQFDCVGRLVNGFPQDVGGILVAPQWVVTAAHCADIVPVTQMTFHIGGNAYGVTEKIIHPGWNTNPANGNDIALLRLSAPVTNVAPAARFTGTDEVGRPCVSVGWGQTGTGLTGNTGPAGTKRAAQNTIDLLGSSAGWSNALILYDFDSPSSTQWNSMGSATPTDLEGGIALGDSGGAVFFEIGGQWRLAGIHSFAGFPTGHPQNYSYGTICGATRVSSFNAWIDGIICYANCDGSTTAPVLNVNDFICFQSAFAAGSPYANCDGSTSAPVLNVNDFICFQSRFAAGCGQ